MIWVKFLSFLRSFFWRFKKISCWQWRSEWLSSCFIKPNHHFFIIYYWRTFRLIKPYIFYIFVRLIVLLNGVCVCIPMSPLMLIITLRNDLQYSGILVTLFLIVNQQLFFGLMPLLFLIFELILILHEERDICAWLMKNIVS